MRVTLQGGPEGLEIVFPARRNVAVAIRFGASLDEVEARAIVERMRQRYRFPDVPTVT